MLAVITHQALLTRSTWLSPSLKQWDWLYGYCGISVVVVEGCIFHPSLCESRTLVIVMSGDIRNCHPGLTWWSSYWKWNRLPLKAEVKERLKQKFKFNKVYCFTQTSYIDSITTQGKYTGEITNVTWSVYLTKHQSRAGALVGRSAAPSQIRPTGWTADSLFSSQN